MRVLLALTIAALAGVCFVEAGAPALAKAAALVGASYVCARAAV